MSRLGLTDGRGCGGGGGTERESRILHGKIEDLQEEELKMRDQVEQLEGKMRSEGAKNW